MRRSDCVSLANLPQAEDRVLMLKYSEWVRVPFCSGLSCPPPPPPQVTSGEGGLRRGPLDPFDSRVGRNLDRR